MSAIQTPKPTTARAHEATSAGRVNSTQPPCAVDAIEQRPDAVDGALARLQQPPPASLRALPPRAREPSTPASIPRSPRSASSRARRTAPSVPERASRPRATRSAERAACRRAGRSSCGVAVGDAQEALAVQVAHDPAPLALGRVEALERVARAQPRVASLRGLGRLQARGPDAGSSRLAPIGTTIVRPAASSSRCAWTSMRWLPTRMRAPVAQRDRLARRARRRRTCRSSSPRPRAAARRRGRCGCGRGCARRSGRRATARSRASARSSGRRRAARACRRRARARAARSPPGAGVPHVHADRRPRDLAPAGRAQHAAQPPTESGWNVGLSPRS